MDELTFAISLQKSHGKNTMHATFLSMYCIRSYSWLKLCNVSCQTSTLNSCTVNKRPFLRIPVICMDITGKGTLGLLLNSIRTWSLIALAVRGCLAYIGFPGCLFSLPSAALTRCVLRPLALPPCLSPLIFPKSIQYVVVWLNARHAVGSCKYRVLALASSDKTHAHRFQ